MHREKQGYPIIIEIALFLIFLFELKLFNRILQTYLFEENF